MITSPQKRALLIGINRYPFLETKDARGNITRNRDLQGCISDISLIRNLLLEKFDFPEKNVTVLTDEQAHREDILAAFKDLTEQTQKDDVVVVMYAGHGSTMTDREGDETDGKDSTMVPYDSGRRFDDLNDYENRDITDDEIYIRLLMPLANKTPHTTLIFDCCQSGTISRDVFGESDRWVEGDSRQVEDLPPSPLAAEEIDLMARGEKGESGFLPVDDRYVLIAGCRVEETAGEYRVPGTQNRHGLMTYFLSQQLTSATSGTTYRDVFEKMVPTLLANAKKPQHPQMEGTRDKELFGIRDIKPMDYVKVAGRSMYSVELSAGSAMGLTPGSEWTVYPEGTKEVNDDTKSLGRVRITDVHAITSTAEIIEETASGAIVASTRAVETARSVKNQELAVQIVVPKTKENSKQRMSDELGYSYKNLLRAVEDEKEADVRIYLVDAGKAIPGTEGPKAAMKDTWAVIGSDGLLLMPLHTTDEQPDPMITVLDNLALIARKRRVLAIVENRKKSPLDGKVRMYLKQKQSNGSWGKAVSGADGLPVYHDGDHIDVTLVNEYDKPVYVHVFDIGVDHSISQIFPPVGGANESLAPNSSYDVGLQGYGTTLPLYVPENYEYDEGTDTVVLFATLEEADFSGLVQEGVRSTDFGDAADSELGQLLAMSLGNSTRNIVAPRPKTDSKDIWTGMKAGLILKRS